MRTALMVAGVLLLILMIAAGVGASRTIGPVRFAGIERDPSLLVRRGTCTEVAQPGITRREIVALLHARDFDILTRVIETRNQCALADPNEEWELGRVIDAFGISDVALAPVFADWIHDKPDSYAPLLASAQHRFILAFVQRGQRLGKETTAEQFKGMSEQLRLLVDDVVAALSKEPKLSEAYRLLVDAARADGTQRDCGVAAEQGLMVMPASYRIRAALAICRLPRWGGTYHLVQAVADAADPFVGDNPLLAALQGFVEWDRGRLATGTEALQHFDAALNYGTHWSFYNDRARIHRGADHFEEALQDSDAALAIAPDSPDVLVGRLYSLLRLGRNDEIPPIVELIEAIDPMNADVPAFKKEALRTAAVEGYNLQQESKSGESIERLTAGIALDGSDADVYYRRGRAYLTDNQDDKALADFENAVRLDPTHFESCRNIDYIYAKRGEWTEVISMWNTYLERKPDDGKAIFERAGAYRHSGNMTLALQDAKAACGLGVQEACAVSSR